MERKNAETLKRGKLKWGAVRNARIAVRTGGLGRARKRPWSGTKSKRLLNSAEGAVAGGGVRAGGIVGGRERAGGAALVGHEIPHPFRRRNGWGTRARQC